MRDRVGEAIFGRPEGRKSGANSAACGINEGATLTPDGRIEAEELYGPFTRTLDVDPQQVKKRGGWHEWRLVEARAGMPCTAECRHGAAGGADRAPDVAPAAGGDLCRQQEHARQRGLSLAQHALVEEL